MQHDAALAITGAIRGTSRENIMLNLAMNISNLGDGWIRRIYFFSQNLVKRIN